MAGDKAIIDSHSFRQKEAIKMTGGNRKAAKIAGLPLAQKHVMDDGRWTDVLQTYCDYFIRY